jgi:hypothetical protein
VTVDGVVLRVHLCADSLGAVTAFVQDLCSVFKSEKEDLYVPHSSYRIGHLAFSGRSRHRENLLCSQRGLRLVEALWVKPLIASHELSFSLFLSVCRRTCLQENARSGSSARHDQ